VLKDWQMGYKPLPQAYERDVMATLIRACVGSDRSKETRFRTSMSLYQEKQLAAKKREQYSSPMKDLEEALVVEKEAYVRFQAGEITKAKLDDICREATR